MIEDEGVRPEGCICEISSDISPNWEDIRTKFGYTMLYEIPNPFEKPKTFNKIGK